MACIGPETAVATLSPDPWGRSTEHEQRQMPPMPAASSVKASIIFENQEAVFRANIDPPTHVKQICFAGRNTVSHSTARRGRLLFRPPK